MGCSATQIDPKQRENVAKVIDNFSIENENYRYLFYRELKLSTTFLVQLSIDNSSSSVIDNSSMGNKEVENVSTEKLNYE